MSVISEQSSLLRSQFFDYLFGDETRGYLCIATADRAKQNFRQKFFVWPDERNELSAYLESVAPNRNVWFCVSLLSAQDRRKEFALPIGFAWAEWDQSIPDDVDPKPTILVESSPGKYHGYWRIEGPAVPADVAEDFSRRLAYRYGADKSGWDNVQLLRVPFTHNLKYNTSPPVKIIDISSDLVTIEQLDAIPPPSLEAELNGDGPTVLEPVPDVDSLPSSESVLYKFKSENRLDDTFVALYTQTPNTNADWSKILWRFIKLCVEMGMTREETFAVALTASCNKYERDNRPIGYLWRDIVKAESEHARFISLIGGEYEALRMPELVKLDEVREDAFIKEYKDWAKIATDAPEQYHELSVFIALSALICSGLYLKVEWGEIVPNLWGLMLGESTLTRKAQPLDAKILTPTGWTTMGEIKVGDEVISQDGKPTKVLGVYPQGDKEVFGITFGDGAYTESCGEHLWTFKGQGNRSEWKTWELEKIRRAGLRYGSSSQWIRHIPVVEPVQFSDSIDNNLPIEPYALGLLLGDGGLSQDSVRFTNHLGDAELVASLMEGLKPLEVKINTAASNGETIDYRIVTSSTEHRGFGKGRVNKLIDALKQLGLMHKLSMHKFVPDEYKFGSIETRLAILQGLMDTDGWVDNRGKSAVFASSSEQLARDVRDIVWSLGGWSSMKIGDLKTFDGVTSRVTSWNVRVNLPDGMVPFRLERKKKNLQRRIPRARTMRSIESVGTKPCQCIKVEHPSGLYVTDDFILTHNTTAMRLATDMLNDIDDSLIVATDGTAEGLLSGLSGRPQRVSIFYKDEVSGFFDSINRKDYLAGLPETLTQLYDVPKILARRLRKETITISEPYFIFFGGGIRDKVYSLLNEEYFLSGFLPRFLVVSGENDLSRVRRTGPPSQSSAERKDRILQTLANLKERYNITVTVPIVGQEVEMRSRIEALLDDDAWELFWEIEEKLTTAGAESDLQMVALPMFTRMAFSILKMSLLVAASRRSPTAANQLMVEKTDVQQAAFYVQKWGHYTIDLITNSIKGSSEKIIDRAMSIVKKKEGITRAELMQRMHLTARDSKELIETLIQRGMVEVKTHGRGHRLYSL